MMLRLFMGVLLMAASCCAHAFDSWEHKQLGDLAYHIALNIYCKNNIGEPCTSRHSTEGDGLKQLYDPLWTDVNGGSYHTQQHRTSYGDVVMCVDFFLSPDKLIAGRERSLISSADKPIKIDDGAPLPVEAPVLFPTLRQQLDLDQGSRCKDELNNLEGARAGHVNHTHFQAEMLVAQRHNHIIALSMRTMEDNLFSALVMNAVSDHFLQDSFAPGHISTWRSRLTDLAANAYHDRVNRKGWDAAIEAKKLKQIIAMKSKKPESQSDDLLSLIHKELNRRLALRRAFFEPDQPHECIRNCRPNDMPPADGYQHELDDLFAALPAQDKPLVVTLRGDSDLWRREQDRQRLVMLMFDIRSIMDVLESRASPETEDNHRSILLVDSFRESGWKWHFLEENEKTAAQQATPAKPPIRWLDWKPSVIQAKVGPLSYGATDGGMPFAPYHQDATLKYTSMDQVFGFSAGADNMAFGDAQTRYVANFETVIWGSASAKRRNDFNSGNYAATIGLQPYVSRDDKGVALSGRLLMVMPAVETSVSVPLRLLHLKTNNGHSEWVPTLGLRVDAGFTSFLTFYLQGGYDAAAQRDGTIRRGLSLGAGFQLAAPTCRIPGIKPMACKD